MLNRLPKRDTPTSFDNQLIAKRPNANSDLHHAERQLQPCFLCSSFTAFLCFSGKNVVPISLRFKKNKVRILVFYHSKRLAWTRQNRGSVNGIGVFCPRDSLSTRKEGKETTLPFGSSPVHGENSSKKKGKEIKPNQYKESKTRMLSHQNLKNLDDCALRSTVPSLVFFLIVLIFIIFKF